MKKIAAQKAIFYSLFILLFFGFGALSIKAALLDSAEMRLVTDKASFLSPDYLDIEILIDAPIASYNAVMGVLNYDPNYLSIEETQIAADFCKLVVPSLPSETEGKKTIICGNPDGNASSTTALAQIRFRKINAGWTDFSLDNSQIHSADGQARDILNPKETYSVLIEK